MGIQRHWHRFVAIGDSTTEGLDDLDESGHYRGWADRLAAHIARYQGDLEYANLALRGRTTAEIRAEQLPRALEFKPDLVSVVAGMNDILAPSFDPVAIATEVEEMFATFIAAGAAVLTFTLPDPTPNLWLTSRWQPRLVAFNEELRGAASRAGAIMVDIGAFPSQSDPRFWSEDRLHGNSFGHERVAYALAHGLGLPGFDQSWLEPLAPLPRPGIAEAVRSDLTWAHQHALPWLLRNMRGRSAGDGRGPKRPEPSPVCRSQA